MEWWRTISLRLSRKTNASDDDVNRATADIFRLPDMEKHPVDSREVPVSLPGAEILLPQESKFSVIVGCRKAILHGITRSSPKRVDIGDKCNFSSEVA